MVGLTKKREEELPAEKPGVTTSTGLQVLPCITPPPPTRPLSVLLAQANCLGAPVAWLSADLLLAHELFPFAEFWQIMIVVLCASFLH